MNRLRDLLLKAKNDQSSKGQTFIILAAAFLVLVAFVGLAVDAGLAFIAYGNWPGQPTRPPWLLLPNTAKDARSVRCRLRLKMPCPSMMLILPI